jgi:hypothetical protein
MGHKPKIGAVLTENELSVFERNRQVSNTRRLMSHSRNLAVHVAKVTIEKPLGLTRLLVRHAERAQTKCLSVKNVVKKFALRASVNGNTSVLRR